MIKEFKDTVLTTLQASEIARDSDEFLYGLILMAEGHNLKRMTASAMLKLMSDGHIPSFDSVSRIRRKIQESHPTLRGKMYAQRHKLQEQVRAEMRIDL